jgi:cytochrome c peroxidase
VTQKTSRRGVRGTSPSPPKPPSTLHGNARRAPVLHALAARAPYFPNGSAAGLNAVVNFYDTRFGVGLTEDEKADLIAFLRTL